MSLREIIRSNQYISRKAAIRQELMPSMLPLNKPTRDVSVSNRSHSITHEDPYVLSGDRKMLFYERQNQQFQIERQANIIYTKQFKTLAKLLGNQSMQYQEIKQKIQTLVLEHNPHPQDNILLQKIQYLEKQLAKKYLSNQLSLKSNNNTNSNEYLKTLQNQLGKKSKLINELSDSIKREAFQDVYLHLNIEVNQKQKNLRILQEQLQDYKLKSAASITFLEEELVKQKQIIQKLTFQIGTWKRKAQNNADQTERLKKKQKQLAINIQTKANYQGVSYGLSSLLLQLQARDKQLENSLEQRQILQSQIQNLKNDFIQLEVNDKKTEHKLLQYEERKKILQIQNSKLQSTISKLSQQLKQSSNYNNQLITQLNDHKTQLQLKLQENNNLNINIKEIETLLIGSQAKNQQYRMIIEDSKTQKYHILQQNQKIRGQINQLIEINERLSHDIEQQKEVFIEKLEEYQIEIKQLHSAIQEKEQFVKAKNSLQIEIQNKYRQESQLKSLIQTYVTKQSQYQSELSKKETIIRQLQSWRMNQEQQLRLHQQQSQDIKNQMIQQELHMNKQKEVLLSQFENERFQWKTQTDMLKQRQNQLESQLQQLSALTNQLRAQKEQLYSKIHELQAESSEKQNDLATFTFNHFQKQSQNIQRLKQRVEQLQTLNADLMQKQERIKLQYSKSFELNTNQLLQSYKQEQNKLSDYNQKLDMQMQRLEIKLRQNQELIISKQNIIQQLEYNLHKRNKQYEQNIEEMKHQFFKKQSQIQQLEQNLQEKMKYQIQSRQSLALVNQLETKIQNILQQSTKNQLTIFNLNQQISRYALLTQSYEEDIKKLRDEAETNNEKVFANYQKIKIYEMQVAQLKEQIKTVRVNNNNNNNNIEQEMVTIRKQLDLAKQSIKRLQVKVQYLQKEISKYQSNIVTAKIHQNINRYQKQLQDQNFQQKNKIISRLSRHSDVSAKNEDNRSKNYSSDGDLSRQILNDPSKISGQQSKFGYNLIFDNSKININKELMVVETIQNIQIKQQKLQQSVISKQIQNKEHDSSKQINPNNISKYSHYTNSKQQKQISFELKKDASESNSNIIHHREANSQQSIKNQQQLVQSVKNISKHYSQKSINDPIQDNGKIIVQHSLQASVNSLQHHQNIAERQVTPSSFKKQSIIHHLNQVYQARPSIIYPTIPEGREENHSRSGSKTKINFSYLKGNNDSSIQKPKILHPQLDASRMSKISRQSHQIPHQLSINQVSPVHLKNSQVKNNISMINQREDINIKPIYNNAFENNSEKSIINAIKSPALQNSLVRQSPSIIQFNRRTEPNLIKKDAKSYLPQSSKIMSNHQTINQHKNQDSYHLSPNHMVYHNTGSKYLQSRQYPQTSQTSNQNTNTNVQPQYTVNKPVIISNYNVNSLNKVQLNRIQTPIEQRKNQKTLTNTKIKMKTTYGREGSLSNDSVTFGKNSSYIPKQADNSIDSGIDVLQVDWQAPCCKND